MGKNHDYVWYVSYGSNLNSERFAYYIKGGHCEFNGRDYDGCRDKTMPSKWLPYRLPYPITFGNEAESWGGKGVAFLDTTSIDKHESYGKAYRVTREQFMDIWQQEGADFLWYNAAIVLGEIDGEQVITITRNLVPTHNEPSQAYKQVIIEGIVATFNEVSKAMAKEYVETRAKEL